MMQNALKTGPGTGVVVVEGARDGLSEAEDTAGRCSRNRGRDPNQLQRLRRNMPIARLADVAHAARAITPDASDPSL